MKKTYMLFALAIIVVSVMVFITSDNYFNRDPVRIIPNDGFLAPSDGIITGIEDNEITIYIGLHDVHIQRSPTNGTITAVTSYRLGNFDYVEITIDSPHDVYTVTQRSGWVARTIQTFVAEGDTVNRGDKLGRILLGSGCIVTVPAEFEIVVNMGSYLKAGEDIIAV